MVFKLYRERRDPRLHIAFRHRGHVRFHRGGSYPPEMTAWDVVGHLRARANAEPDDEVYSVDGRQLWPPAERG